MVFIVFVVIILYGNGVFWEIIVVLYMVRLRELYGKRKGRNVGCYIVIIIDWIDVF